jgi:hypothetical protein
VQRAKNSGILITFTDNSTKNLIPYIIFGIISVLFGISIYYFLPNGLLSQNLSIILPIFFMILLGMITGLTILATNLQGLLEMIFVYVFFFWERESIRVLLRKNLSSHKHRNYLTSLIYSLSLGVIIFLLVSASLQIQTIATLDVITGPDIYCNEDMLIIANKTDPVLLKYKDYIKDFAYMSMNANE